MAADLGGEGFLDVAAAVKEDNMLAWYRNDAKQHSRISRSTIRHSELTV